jgi:hypothetical protein
VFAFDLTIGRVFSPFFIIRIVFLSDIASFSSSFESNLYPNEILATQFPKLLKLRTLDSLGLAKKRPHPLTRRLEEKRVTSLEEFSSGEKSQVVYGRKPYTGTGTLAASETEL